MNNPDHKIINADCMDAMAGMDENSVHAVVTDPPYGMAFMPDVNDWDSFNTPLDYQEWCKEWASEALRVLKPGGHLIAFSGTRTYGFLMCGVHSAGFEIRDTITWHFGDGFGGGKMLDVSDWMSDKEDIDEWSGFKMGLRPATEFAALARRPFDGSTYENVLRHETGALNVDGARTPPRGDRGGGRHPTNLCLDPAASEMVDDQSGYSESKRSHRGISFSGSDDANTHEGYARPAHRDYESTIRGYDDEGGASRFFYTAKSSANERTINGQVENNHSTVKPLDLMEWLVTLVTAPGQRVLDPFAGSGTTIMACRRLGRKGIGIEKDADHAEVARKRVDLAHELETDQNNSSSEEITGEPDGDNGSNENGQQGLDVFTDGGKSSNSK